MGKRARTASSGSGTQKAKCSISARCTLFCVHRKSKFKLASKKNNKRPAGGMLLKDWISELPPEILVEILSHMKMKEVGRTSILSKSWRYLWTSSRNLDFDASEVLYDIVRGVKFPEVELPIYVSWVNDVIRLHQGQTTDQFSIVFSLDESSGSDIDRWVSFAVRKKVQRLKLDLRRPGGSIQDYSYTFPHSLEISRCSSLTSLHLASVDITGEVLELFLCNCLNLESLFVRRSRTLRSLNVDGRSLKLRSLELRYCLQVKHLSVSAPNLVSFKYLGRRIPMPLKDVPKLVEISIEHSYSRELTSILDLSELSSFFSRLEKLTLEACEVKENIRDPRFPSFPKLKHLTLTIDTKGVKSLLVYTAMINACPSLYKFSLQITCEDHLTSYGRLPLTIKTPPHSIKELEFLGFHGEVFDREFAMYLIDNAAELEKITFDPLIPIFRRSGYSLTGDLRVTGTRARQASAAIVRAKLITRKIAPTVELIIIE